MSAPLTINPSSIPRLDGKTVLITGGSSGIGYAASCIFAEAGARVYILDLDPPESNSNPLPHGASFIQGDVCVWHDLYGAFRRVRAETGGVDIAVANAGVSEAEGDWLGQGIGKMFGDRDKEEIQGKDWPGHEPPYHVLEVNLKGVLNFVKLAIEDMRSRTSSERKQEQGKIQNNTGVVNGVNAKPPGVMSQKSLDRVRKRTREGSIVITSSATAYSPEHSLPIYSACKAALIGLVRSLRSSLWLDNITINAVAPAATITKLLPENLAAPLMAAGLPTSSARMVGLAIAYSATARQSCRVEDYGRDADRPQDSSRGDDESAAGEGRWNGRVILTLGEEYTELEEGLARLKPVWFGEENTRLTALQQRATDFRPLDGR